MSRAASGFGVVEVIVSAAILLGALGGALALRAASVERERAERAAREAEAIADDLLEAILAAPPSEMAARAGVAPVVTRGEDVFHPFIEIEPVEGSDTLTRVRVVVSFGGGRSFALETLRSVWW